MGCEKGRNLQRGSYDVCTFNQLQKLIKRHPNDYRHVLEQARDWGVEIGEHGECLPTCKHYIKNGDSTKSNKTKSEIILPGSPSQILWPNQFYSKREGKD